MVKKTAKLETRGCANCGRPLTRQLSQTKGRANWYCGPVCKSRHMPSPMIQAGAARETRPCPNCEKPVTRYLSTIRAGGGWACSHSCAATIRGLRLVAEGKWTRPQRPRKGITISCKTCGADVYQGPGQKRSYCSVACHNIGQSKDSLLRNCQRCGKAMKLCPSQDARVFCSHDCAVVGKIARPTGRVHNGKPVIVNNGGYLTVFEPDHPAANQRGRVLEHRIVMEKLLGRYLTKDEHVDHINGVKDDNRPENLQVLTSSEHSKKTNAEQRAKMEQRLLDELIEYRRRFGQLDQPE